MSRSAPRGIRRGPLEASFDEQQALKSELIIQAQLLRQSHDDEGAARKFAEAAEIEERLAHACDSQKLSAKASVHRFSAASCWAQAGNFYRALALCEQLLSDPELPPPFSQRVASYAGSLRTRRSDWYEALLAHAAGAEP